MKEIVEKGIIYVVSDNYPEIPYTKAIKSNPVVIPGPVDPLTMINEKLDIIGKEVAEIKAQVVPK